MRTGIKYFVGASMKKLRIPIPYRIVAAIKGKFPFTKPVFKAFRIIFENIIVKSIVTISLPVFFLIEGRLIDFQKDDLFTRGFFFETKPLFITAVIFIIVSAIISAVERHSKYYIEMSKSYYELLEKVNVLQKDISSEINHINKNINSFNNFQNNTILKLNEVMDNNSIVERIGGFICNIVYDWLVELTEEKCFNITYVQRFKSANTDDEYIEMLTYKNKDEKIPSTFGVQIKLNNASEKKYYHRGLFEQNINDIQILVNRKEISDNFKEMEDNILNDDKTKQYVCFPVKINKKTMMLFQITACKEKVLGKNKSEIKRNMRMLLPIISMITPFYYKDYLMKELCNNIVNCFDRYTLKGKKGKGV